MSTMQPRTGREVSGLGLIAPLGVAGIFVAANTRLDEPRRQVLRAQMVTGAGAAYLGGGLGFWEVAFCALLTYFGFRGLRDYRFVGVGWLLHTVWDLVHHLYGNPILPSVPTSSAGCAICDLAIAAWYLRLAVRKDHPAV